MRNSYAGQEIYVDVGGLRRVPWEIPADVFIKNAYFFLIQKKPFKINRGIRKLWDGILSKGRLKIHQKVIKRLEKKNRPRKLLRNRRTP